MQRAFETFPARSIDFAFLTLQCCIDDALAINGDNDYSIRHIGKEALLPTGIVVSALALTLHTYCPMRIVISILLLELL